MATTFLNPLTLKPSPLLTKPSPLFHKPQRPKPLNVTSYLERNPNSPGSIAARLIGALPVVGLVARIFNDEGGVGDDLLDFAEFRRRVGNKCAVNDSQAFYLFKDRRGPVGDSFYVLMCCWLAAVGAGLLKTEEIYEGVARLRISNDIEYEEETFLAMMTQAKEKRVKTNNPMPQIAMEIRVEKALEAIYVCCFGQDPIENEDIRLLSSILNAVFPSVGRKEVENIVKNASKQINEGGKSKFPSTKQVSKVVLERQLKDLDFLRQNPLN